jgi:protein-disulfide isomerase
MRIVIAAMTLSFVLGAASGAFAQSPPMGRITPDVGAGASAQPQIPSAVQPTGNTTNNNASSNTMPVQPITPPAAADNGTSPNTFSEPNLKTPKAVNGKSTSYVIKDAPLPSDYVMGKAQARLIMIEYASLSCPHCAHFSNAILPELIKKYVDKGEMRYILRQFPLNDPALKGAMLLDCVGEQDKAKYFTFAKVLFDAQSKWAFDSNYMSGLQTIAEVGGVSKEQFKRCTTNTAREMQVLKAKKLAADELALPHTPYIFIGGEVYNGDRSVEAMSAFIEKKLEQNTEK